VLCITKGAASCGSSPLGHASIISTPNSACTAADSALSTQAHLPVSAHQASGKQANNLTCPADSTALSTHAHWLASERAASQRQAGKQQHLHSRCSAPFCCQWQHRKHEQHSSAHSHT
jgi:hypothetical protein